MLQEFTDWLLDLVVDFLAAVVELLTDVFITIVELFLGAILVLIGLIPVPEFLSSGLQGMWSGLPGGILWVATEAGVPQALSIIGAGYLFRLGRKVATLFQW